MPVVSLSVESELLGKFEKIVKREGFKSKSEAFRVAIHDFILKYQFTELEENEFVEMIIGFSYVDSIRMRNNLSKIQHEYIANIQETLHRHISNNMCFELVIVQGNRKELRTLANNIRATRGVESFYTTSFIRNGEDTGKLKTS